MDVDVAVVVACSCSAQQQHTASHTTRHTTSCRRVPMELGVRVCMCECVSEGGEQTGEHPTVAVEAAVSVSERASGARVRGARDAEATTNE